MENPILRYVDLNMSRHYSTWQEYVSKLTSSSVDKVMKMRKALHGRFELPPVIHHGGPCMPGVLRLFVRCDGALFPCERVNEQLEYYQIGTVNDGFNLKRVKEYFKDRTVLEISAVTQKGVKELKYKIFEEAKTC